VNYMLVGYVRVSMEKMSLERQVDALVEYGVDERNIYDEKATGTKRERTELNRMINELKEGDTCVIAELTRISRSTKDIFEIVGLIEAKGADIKSLKEAWLDTTTPQGKLMFTIFAGLSQFERDLTAQRTREGLAAARARGRYGGRPNKRNAKALTVQLLYEQGVKIVDIVKQTELSRSTIHRIIRDAKVAK
jgi:DNA invertase Pin-like site-specific DNA recombinase